MGNYPSVCLTVSRCFANEHIMIFFRVKKICTVNTLDVF